jgi:hypothetical protein
MNKVGFLFLGAVLTIAGSSALLAGCGSDTGSTGGGSSTGEGTTTTGTGGTGGGGGGATTTTTTSSTSSTGTGMSATLDCPSYCAEVMANCTGANSQYTTNESCLAVCKAFPEGKLGATDGDTLGCRLYHGGLPATMDAVTHCPHAGPTGGDKDVSDTTAGTCGEGCDSFCNIAIAACTGANVQYATKEACLTECKTFKASATNFNSVDDTDKNDFGCRMYHLTVAATDAASATTHCPHIKAVSATCTK